jgi:hypothetical protein
VVLVYHSLSFWFWTANQGRAGHRAISSSFRIGWALANFVTGVLAVVVAWTGA